MFDEVNILVESRIYKKRNWLSFSLNKTIIYILEVIQKRTQMKKYLILNIFLTTISFSNCFNDSIIEPSPFLGNNDEIFKLKNGSLWKVKYEYSYLYAYYPNVIICPNDNKLIIQGNKLNIEPIRNQSISISDNKIIESQIDGTFNGWDGDSIYQLTNGQVWQQATYKYSYSYAYRPKVIIFKKHNRYHMIVNNTAEVEVKKIN
jgi:hypothetical protein